jgi:hypothetical protein
MRDCPLCQAGKHDEPWFCEEHRVLHGTCHRHKGLPCHGSLPAGMRTCRMHSGAHGPAKIVMGRAAKARHFVPVEIHPAEALLREVAWWNGQCLWLDEMVSALQRGEMTWGMVRRTGEWESGVPSGLTVIEESGLHALVAWQQRAHRDLAQVSRWALDAAADERLVRLAEAQGARLHAAYKRGLDRIGLTEAQWERARAGYAEVLAELVA